MFWTATPGPRNLSRSWGVVIGSVVLMVAGGSWAVAQPASETSESAPSVTEAPQAAGPTASSGSEAASEAGPDASATSSSAAAVSPSNEERRGRTNDSTLPAEFVTAKQAMTKMAERSEWVPLVSTYVDPDGLAVLQASGATVEQIAKRLADSGRGKRLFMALQKSAKLTPLVTEGGRRITYQFEMDPNQGDLLPPMTFVRRGESWYLRN